MVLTIRYNLHYNMFNRWSIWSKRIPKTIILVTCSTCRLYCINEATENVWKSTRAPLNYRSLFMYENIPEYWPVLIPANVFRISYASLKLRVWRLCYLLDNSLCVDYNYSLRSRYYNSEDLILCIIIMTRNYFET